MFVWTKTLLTIFLFFMTVIISSADVTMNDGLWEISSKMEVPGMPMEMPPVKFKQCLTSKDSIPQNKNDLHNCKIKSSDINGSTVTWEMHCMNDGQTMISKGKTTYSNDTFKGEVKTAMNGMNMTQHMSGRRLGNCK